MKKLKINSLYAVVALTLSAMASQHAHTNDTLDRYRTVGDLEIYHKPEQGNVTVSMMLDMSGSMLAVDFDKSLPNNNSAFWKTKGVVYVECQYGVKNKQATNKAYAATVPITMPITDENGNLDSSISFDVTACPNSYGQPMSLKDNNTLNPTIVNGTVNRIGNLKMGLIALLANGKAIDSKHSIGIGQFPHYDADQSGSMQVPAKPLTLEHRKKLINYVVSLKASGYTPISTAYAEVAGYMLGNNPSTEHRFPNGVPRSGYHLSSADTKVADGSEYQSPLQGAKSSECSVNGIYFLTDGTPNYSDSVATPAIMEKALGKKPVGDSTHTLKNTAQDSGWDWIGRLSQELVKESKESTLAPRGLRTATVGFGRVFDGFTEKEVEVVTVSGKKEVRRVPDCNSRVSQDAKNLCLWGELPGEVTDAKALDRGRPTGHYGKGGFTKTGTPKGLEDSVKNFLASLSMQLETSPSGTISIPLDPLNSQTIQPYAYLPMVQPEVGTTKAVWGGNLKKYHTLYGTLYGQSGQRLYMPDATKATRGNESFPSQLNPNAKDIWQDASDTGSAGLISTGGSRSKVVAKDRSNLTNKTSRVVYIEGGTVGSPQTVKVQIVNGTMTFTPTNPDLSRYTIEDLAYLANYLGFAVPKEASNYSGANLTAQIASLNTTINATAMTDTSVFGGVLHSVPVLAAYEGKFDDETGNINTSADKRKDYLLYGTMEGSLRMADAKDGTEAFAFIPRTIFDNQREALAFGAVGNTDQPFFGVDAPWMTSADYDFETTTSDGRDVLSGVKAKAMYAYGGLRMGGVGFYGLDITNPSNPEIKFAITNATSGFERLGQTWSKPAVTKIKTGPKDEDSLDVLVFGGGYDMCYENPKFTLNDPANKDAKCANKSQAQGNAIYMVDAKTGKLIASWGSSSSAGDDRKEMTHSFVGEMVTLDRNNNGFVDSIYASDLGGQLFRIDLKEGVRGATMTRRVVRVFNANDGSLPEGTPPLRFYEKPMVSFYDHNNGTLAMVNVASGDRSSPLHEHRDTLAKSNRIYGIIDRDLTTHRIAAPGMPSITRNLTHKDLQEYDTTKLKSQAKNKELIENLRTPKEDGTYIAQGWWYPMTRFDVYTDVKNLKAVGSSLVSGGILYTSVYNPDYQYTKTESCTARVVGATERQMFCLPWGICANTDQKSKDYGKLIEGSTNGTLGFNKAGPGIQEIAMSTLTSQADKSTNFKIFVGQQTAKERTDDSKKSDNIVPLPSAENSAVSENGGTPNGNGYNPVQMALIQRMSKRLKVDRWYDLANAESNQ